MRYIALLCYIFSTYCLSQEVFVTLPTRNKSLKTQLKTIKVKESALRDIARQMHLINRHCGGFTTSPKENLLPAKEVINKLTYSYQREDLIKLMFKQVSENNLFKVIETLSSYKNRYYKSKSGVQAVVDLKEHWQKLTKNRSDIEVKLFKHKNWPQPSVILKIQGSSNKDIILGGHVDSINTDDEGVHSKAPGADDNASGIAVLTEIIRLLVENSYNSVHNIYFMAYAAEEVGLRGSMEIAEKFREKKHDVIGSLQFDMVNFNGSDIKFAFIKDNTDKKQNIFLTKLIDKYLKVPWGYDKCNYACSDHYSWSYHGFVASFPAASRIKEENPTLHTEKDTLATSDYSVKHAVNFVKLGLSYIIELDK